MEEYCIKNPALADQGERKIKWANRFMKVLNTLKDRLSKGVYKPLDGVRIGVCLHLEAKTACLLKALCELGAEVIAAGSNPLSTQDDVAAAMVADGIKVYSWRGMTPAEYHANLDCVLAWDPQIIIDDGADLIALVHKERRDLIPHIKGACEETTTGVNRLRVMAKNNELGFPVIAVNDAYSKFLFDNRYGTGQSTWDAIMRTTNLLVAGKTVVMVGYGWCGRGIATKGAALGANVIVVETDPHKALEALMDGFRVMSMEEAAREGDIFITSTGCNRVIRKEHLELMKDSAILANAGHFNVEISIPDLESLSVSVEEVRPNVKEYKLKDGRSLYLLADGRLVNLAAGDGHPIEIMDLSFALQMLSVIYVNEHELSPGVYKVPDEIDVEVARLKLETSGVNIEKLTEEQQKYLQSWEVD